MSKSWVKTSAIIVTILTLFVFSVATITTYAKQDKVSGGFSEVTPPTLPTKPMIPPGLGKGLRQWLIRYIELSEDFKVKIREILVNNETTKSLIDKGFNITSIRPYIKLVVLGDGSVVLRVTEVLVTLYKRGEGVVYVLVDYVNGKVMHVWGSNICACPCDIVRPNTTSNIP